MSTKLKIRQQTTDPDGKLRIIETDSFRGTDSYTQEDIKKRMAEARLRSEKENASQPKPEGGHQIG